MDESQVLQRLGELIQFKDSTNKRLDTIEKNVENFGDIRVMLTGMSKDIGFIQDRSKESDKKMDAIQHKNDTNNAEIKTLINELSTRFDNISNAPAKKFWQTFLENKKTVRTVAITTVVIALVGYLIDNLPILLKFMIGG